MKYHVSRRRTRLALLPVIAALLLAMVPRGGSAAATADALLPDNQLHAIAEEINGLIAKDTIIQLGRYHRVQASSGFEQAAQFVAERAKSYGLEDVHIERFPSDGRKTYYSLKSTPAWEAESGQLWETGPKPQKIADYGAMKVALADYSQSADVTAELVNVGQGDKESDYNGVDVKDKIVLAGGYLATVHKLACDERGAAGIVSFMPNQVTGWSGDYVDNVRWGHLDPYNAANKFAFMISLREARLLRERLAAGEHITLHAAVKAQMEPGNYDIVTGVIPGTDLANEEIVFSCHLCHQKPGANDNASGAAAILEVARTLITLINRGSIPRPRRTIRFIWPPEITGTLVYFSQHPDEVKRMKAAIHLDMVGGFYPITKSVLHMTHTPASLPSCVNAVGDAFTQYTIDASARAASDGEVAGGLIEQDGSKDNLVADITPFDMGSDHDVYEEGSFQIPTVYLRDWPDVFIHTNNDTPANIDPTKMKRSSFIAACSGYFMASAGAAQASRLADAVFADALSSIPREKIRADAIERSMANGAEESRTVIATSLEISQQALQSVRMFAPNDAGLESKVDGLVDQLSGAWLVFTGQLSQERHGKKTYFVIQPKEQSEKDDKKHKKGREESPAVSGRFQSVPVRTVYGPMEVYYYNYLTDHAGKADMSIARKIGSMPKGGILQYEILNLVDGKRSIQDIRDYITTAYEPIAVEDVAAYLNLLQQAGAVAINQK